MLLLLEGFEVDKEEDGVEDGFDEESKDDKDRSSLEVSE